MLVPGNGRHAERPLALLAFAVFATGCAAGTTPPSVTPYNQIALLAGDNQSGLVNTAVAVRPSVRVTNQDNKPVGGITVTFAITTIAGAVTGAVQITDTAGIATVGSWRLGPGAQANTLTATASGVIGSPVTFTATGTVAPVPPKLTIIDGDIQTAHAGTTVARAPSVRVTDSDGNPLGGVAVTFFVSAGGGSIAQPNAVTNAAGIAVAGTWTLGPATGISNNSLTSAAPGLIGSPAVFNAWAIGNTIQVGTVAVGRSHACAIVGATVLCWGDNDDGQLGDGTTTQRNVPVVVSGLTFISAGDRHTCGVDGAFGAFARCWGDGAAIGIGTLDGSPRPVTVAGGLYLFVSAGGTHSCGITGRAGIANTFGLVYCWGGNSNGQLGDGTQVDRLQVFAKVSDTNFTAVAAGAQHSCALAVSGSIQCWGANESGELGDGTNLQRLTPVVVVGGVTFESVAAGFDHTCALAVDSTAYCWGDNSAGELGDGTTTQRLAPVPVLGNVIFQSIGTGHGLTCGLSTVGAAYCWGAGYASTPVVVPSGPTFRSLGVGGTSVCGVVTSRDLYCWGRNDRGQLGDGTTIDRAVPTLVRWP